MAAGPPADEQFFPFSISIQIHTTQLGLSSHSHTPENTRMDTSAGAAGNIEVKESLSGFLSVPTRSSFNDVRACEM